MSGSPVGLATLRITLMALVFFKSHPPECLFSVNAPYRPLPFSTLPDSLHSPAPCWTCSYMTPPWEIGACPTAAQSPLSLYFSLTITSPHLLFFFFLCFDGDASLQRTGRVRHRPCFFLTDKATVSGYTPFLLVTEWLCWPFFSPLFCFDLTSNEGRS